MFFFLIVEKSVGLDGVNNFGDNKNSLHIVDIGFSVDSEQALLGIHGFVGCLECLGVGCIGSRLLLLLFGRGSDIL